MAYNINNYIMQIFYFIVLWNRISEWQILSLLLSGIWNIEAWKEFYDTKQYTIIISNKLFLCALKSIANKIIFLTQITSVLLNRRDAVMQGNS